MRVSVVIPSAGKSLRFLEGSEAQAPRNRKQFRTLGGDPLIFVTLQPFLASQMIKSIVLAVPEDSLDWIEHQLGGRQFEKEVRVVVGGSKRQMSVRNGLEVVADTCDVVVIHDAVRPFLKKEWIGETIDLCTRYDGAIVAVRAKDTLKQVNDRIIQATLDRSDVWYAQTPQTFRTEALLSAFENAEDKGIFGTDEAQLVELNGGQVAIIEGNSQNIKITTKEDWELAEAIWKGSTIN